MSAASAAAARPQRLAIIGDVFCDLTATGMAGLPEWGGDREVVSPIRMLPGGSGLNVRAQAHHPSRPR